MKIRTLILSLLVALPLSVAASSLTQSDENSVQESDALEQGSAEADDDDGDDGDRGFDPCLLNASLAICNQQ